MKNNIVLKLTEAQNDALIGYYEKQFPNSPSAKIVNYGVIMGQPDMNSGKIQFAAFRYHEYLILKVALWLIKLMRLDFEKSTNFAWYDKRMYSLENAEPKA